jgi:hypothetical protein
MRLAKLQRPIAAEAGSLVRNWPNCRGWGYEQTGGSAPRRELVEMHRLVV